MQHTFAINNMQKMFRICYFFFKFHFKSIRLSIKIISKFEIKRRNRSLLYFNDNVLIQKKKKKFVFFQIQKI